MKIIKPIAITDVMLTACNVAETDYAAYVAGTTYASGDRVVVTDPGIHKIYESLQNANTGNYPPDNATWWVAVSATNRWKVFDGVVQDQMNAVTGELEAEGGAHDGYQITDESGFEILMTEQGSASYTIAPGQVVNSIALLNVDAVSVQVTMTDPLNGVVYDKTYNLLKAVNVAGEAVYDWFSYFFSTYYRVNDIVKFDLPPYVNASIQITLNYPNGTVKCGEIVLGTMINIGDTQYGAAPYIYDYSIKEADQWGIYRITPRSISKNMEAPIVIPNRYLDHVYYLLGTLHTTPLVWVGHEDYTSLIIYGYYKELRPVIDYPDCSHCVIEIIGLPYQ